MNCVNDFANSSSIGSAVVATFDDIIDDIVRTAAAYPSEPVLLYSTDLESAYM